MSISKSRSKKTAPHSQSAHPTGNPALDLFHRLWQAIEKQQAKNDKFANDSHLIYQRFSCEIEPLERQQCALIYQLCERLVPFTARKSFTNWQRDMLHEWIHELLDYLESNPFRGELDLSAIAMQLQTHASTQMDEEMLDQQCDFIRDMLLDACGHAPDDPAILRNFVRDPQQLRDYLHEAQATARSHAAQDEEEEMGDGAGHWDDEQDESFADHAYDEHALGADSDQAARVDALFNKSTLKQLYRKLAMVLHPDREPDPAKQADKTRIMGQLTEAWEKKEMFTLLQLAHTHLPSAENLLSEENLAYINPLLQRRRHELEMHYYREREGGGMIGLVVNKFKQASKKKTDLAFADHQDYLQRDIEALTAQLAQITTLQTLKPHLAERWDELHQARWDDEPDLDWMFR